jgi:hypothetical protein
MSFHSIFGSLTGKPLWPYKPSEPDAKETSENNLLAPHAAHVTRLLDTALAKPIEAPPQMAPTEPTAPPSGWLWRPLYQRVPFTVSDKNAIASPHQPAPRLWATDLNELHTQYMERRGIDNRVEAMDARQAWVQLAREGLVGCRKDKYTALVDLTKPLT